MLTPETFSRYVRWELDNPPGTRAKRLRTFAAEEWMSAAGITKSHGIPSRLLRDMREAGCGPPWRPAGRAILYNVNEFEKWLQGCPGFLRSPRVAQQAALYVSLHPRQGDSWESRARITQQFSLWLLCREGTLPVGWRQELWRQIRMDGRKLVWRQGEFARVRAVEPWGKLETSAGGRASFSVRNHIANAVAGQALACPLVSIQRCMYPHCHKPCSVAL
jgi:hypothetical protein